MTEVVTPERMLDLLVGDVYLHLPSQRHPSGELRGQLEPELPVRFQARLDGDQQVPPVSTMARGTAIAMYDAVGSTLVVTVDTQGLVGTSATIRVGARGTTGAVRLTLQGGPSVWQGAFSSLAPSTLALLRTDKLYVDVASASHPTGELRGQLGPIDDLTRYGFGCGTSAVDAPWIASKGAAQLGSSGFEVRLLRAGPGSMAMLMLGIESEQCCSPTGNVRARKKSTPSTRC